MKIREFIITGLMVAALGIVTGCTKQNTVDTAPLVKSFQPAEAALKTSIDSAVTAIKKSDYSAALAELQKLAKNTKLTPEQQQAIKDVVAQIQKVMEETATKASGEANKAATDLQKSLPK